jgi:hypothetical protein
MTCYTLLPIRGTTVRGTKLDSCGAPVHGPKSTVTSEGFVSVELTMEVEDGTDYQLRGANDKFIYNSRGRPRLRWVNAVINMAQVDPELYNLMTSSPLVVNDAATPESVGFRIQEDATGFGNFALEVWTEMDGACVNGAPAYGYLLLPWIVDAMIGDVTVQNEPVTIPISRARTNRNSLWGVGPYNVNNKLTAPTGPAPLLTAIGPKDHLDFHLTTLAPPAATCGAVALA